MKQTLPAVLREEHAFSEIKSDEYEVLRDQYLIKGVVVLQEKSRNGRTYTRQSREDAMPLYERRAVHIGHETGESYEKRNGALINSRMDTIGRVIADWSLNKGHVLTEQILDDAEKRPYNLALSHEVPQGGFEAQFVEGGTLQVDRIHKMDIVSVVTDGGTNRGLNEGLEMEAARLTKFEETAEAILAALKEANVAKKNVSHSDSIEALVTALKECGCQGAVDGESAELKELRDKLAKIESEKAELQEKLEALEPQLQEFLSKEAAAVAATEIKEIMEELKVDQEKVSENLMARLVEMEDSDRRLFLEPLGGTLQEGAEKEEQKGGLKEEKLKSPKSKAGVSGEDKADSHEGIIFGKLFGSVPL